jgi:hypothetical protein
VPKGHTARRRGPISGWQVLHLSGMALANNYLGFSRDAKRIWLLTNCYKGGPSAKIVLHVNRFWPSLTLRALWPMPPATGWAKRQTLSARIPPAGAYPRSSAEGSAAISVIAQLSIGRDAWFDPRNTVPKPNAARALYLIPSKLRNRFLVLTMCLLDHQTRSSILHK